MSVICGAGDGKILRPLECVGLLELSEVEFFMTFNNGMPVECELACLRLWPVRIDGEVPNFHAGTENVYLRGWFESNSAETKGVDEKSPDYASRTHVGGSLKIDYLFFRADRMVDP